MKSPKEIVQNLVANRTGIEVSPADAKELISATEKTIPSMAGDESGIAAVRQEYASRSEGGVGSTPPPSTLRGAAATMMKMAQGESMSVLLDKIGERLAFERTGTRLYDALISKYPGATEGGPSLMELEAIQREEAEHFEMLQTTMKALGGDPTAMTPSADVSGVLSMGLPQVLLDARTNFHQCLEAILLAELADNDGWEMLIALSKELGQDQIATRFERALAEEAVHLAKVRAWLKQSTMERAHGRTVEA